MQRTRDWRRAQWQRIRAKRLGYMRLWRTGEPDNTAIGRFATTPHPCSARCCGNQRKFYGPTVQEIKYRPEGLTHLKGHIHYG